MNSWYTLQQTTQAHIEGFYLERAMDRLVAIADDPASARHQRLRALRVLMLRIIRPSTRLPAPLPLETVKPC